MGSSQNSLPRVKVLNTSFRGYSAGTDISSLSEKDMVLLTAQNAKLRYSMITERRQHCDIVPTKNRRARRAERALVMQQVELLKSANVAKGGEVNG